VSPPRITADLKGKPVVESDGTRIGIVSGVRDGTAYVEPNPGITDSVRSKLGWERVDTDDYPLAESEIQNITDDEIRLE
jgi:hypothetical protein